MQEREKSQRPKSWKQTRKNKIKPGLNLIAWARLIRADGIYKPREDIELGDIGEVRHLLLQGSSKSKASDWALHHHSDCRNCEPSLDRRSRLLLQNLENRRVTIFGNSRNDHTSRRDHIAHHLTSFGVPPRLETRWEEESNI